MILRRITQHVKDQNWFAVALDFVIVVFGVYIGVWIGSLQEKKSTLEKQELVVEALRQDMILIGNLDQQFRDNIDREFEKWKKAFDNGQRPPPVFYRIPGSDTPPQHIWNSIQQNRLTDLFSTDLLNDLGLYYSELEGVSKKYVRYIEFVETDILPGLKENPSYFYRADGDRLKSQYESSMDRLWEYRQENARLTLWSTCLAKRLETPTNPDGNCAPDLATPAFDSKWSEP